MPSDYWKRSERRQAEKLGTNRASKGHQGEASPDYETDWLSVELKCRKNGLPKWLGEAIAQAARNASDGKLPIVRIHQKWRHDKSDWVLLRWSDFSEWFGGWPGMEEDCDV